MTTIAHISDLHFGRHIPEVVDGLLARLETINPDLVVISGDLTQRALPAEFADARDFVQSLTWPRLVVPGNHDQPAYNVVQRFTDPWKLWRRYLGDTLEPVQSVSHCVAVGVNTARRAGLTLDWSRGRISRDQIQSAVGKLQYVPDETLRLVAAHHPFWLPEGYGDWGVVGGRNEAITALADTGVDLILSGHVHLFFSHALKGVVISHAGTTTSDRLLSGFPNNFVLIEGDRSRLVLTQMTWSGAAFAPSTSREFIRGSAGWTMLREVSARSRKHGLGSKWSGAET